MLGFRNFKDFSNSIVNVNLINIQITLGTILGIIDGFTGKYVWEKPEQIYFLIILVILDMITGVIVSVKSRIFSSRRLPRFVMTLSAYICLLAIAKFIESNINFLGGWVGGIFYTSFVITQFVSLLENLGKLNIPGVSQISAIREMILQKAESSTGISFKDVKKDSELKVLTMMVEFARNVDADYIHLVKWKKEENSDGRFTYSPETLLIYTKPNLSDFYINPKALEQEHLYNFSQSKKQNIKKWEKGLGLNGKILTMASIQIDIDSLLEIYPVLIVGWENSIEGIGDLTIADNKIFIENIKIISK